MAERRLIETSLYVLLRPEGVRDYGTNGLQVDGCTEARCIAQGVAVKRK